MSSAFAHLPLGQPVPNRLHAVSCSLPTMRDVIGYEEKDPATLAHLSSGYPRFVVHPLLRLVAEHLRRRQPALAARELWLCAGPLVAADLHAHLGLGPAALLVPVAAHLTALALPAGAPPELSRQAKLYLQHTGGFASSRAAEDWLVAAGALPATATEGLAPAATAGTHVRRTLAGFLAHSLPADDVHLSPSGMAATYAAFQAVNAVQAPRGRTRWVQLGWLYLDTIAILQKFTARPAEDYLRHSDVFDLDGLARLLDAHTGRVAGIFAEVPTNPLVQTPDLAAVVALCRARGIALVVDPTLASPLNLDVLPLADVVVCSLTKYAAGEGDVILGSAALNPASPFADGLRPALTAACTRPVVYSRDVARLAAQIDATPSLVARINVNTPRVAAFLAAHPAVAEVYWAGHPASAAHYAKLRRPGGGPGCMITFTLRPEIDPSRVYDRLRLAKGPSFGLYTTLLCPFMFLAHYNLASTPEGRASLRRDGLDPDLLRLSVGAEPVDELLAVLAEALAD